MIRDMFEDMPIISSIIAIFILGLVFLMIDRIASKPETVDKSLINEPQLVKIPKIKKHDAKTFFIDELVHAYFVNKKLKDLSEDEFIYPWENIFR